MRHAFLAVALFAKAACFASLAMGQTPDMAPVPSPMDPDDIDEVDDIVEDQAVLPKGDALPRSAKGRANVEAIERTMAEELAETNSEIRARHDYGVSVGVGMSRPWQNYSVDAFSLINPNFAVGMYAGGGHVSQPGQALEQTYSLSINARAFGVSSRYYFQRLDHCSVEAVLGYAAWDGNLKPQGSDDELSDETEKLSASFHATGFSGGVGFSLDWIFHDNVMIDWTLVGIRRAEVSSLDLSRDSGVTQRAIKRDIERAAFYGLTNIRVGYLF